MGILRTLLGLGAYFLTDVHFGYLPQGKVIDKSGLQYAMLTAF